MTGINWDIQLGNNINKKNNVFLADFPLKRFVVFHTSNDSVWLESCFDSLTCAEQEALRLKNEQPTNEVYIMEINRRVKKIEVPQFEVVDI